MGSGRILKKPSLIRNSIGKQNKQSANSLTIKEWNDVVNALRVQANFNTKYLEDLHRVLFYDWDQNSTGYILAVDAFDNGFLTEVMQAVAEQKLTVDQLQSDMIVVKGITDGLRTDIHDLKMYHYGVDRPENYQPGDLWLQVEEE